MPLFAIDQQARDRADEISISRQDLVQMVDDLFTSMLNLAVDTNPRPVADVDDDALSASVRIDGGFRVLVQVIATERLSRMIASVMFGIPKADIEPEEIYDALGEISNVIGGNVKGVIDRDCHLSLPCVGPAATALQPDGQAIAFEIQGEPLTIVLAQN